MVRGWSEKRGNISQRILGGMRSEAPLKTRIDGAQKQLEARIAKLEGIHASLQKRDGLLFEKIVSAQKMHDEQSARAHALELGEVRKMKGIIGNAMLAMEQVRTRLGTVSEFGDIVVTLSPCMSIIKDLPDSVKGFMSGANESLDEYAKTFNEVITGSSLGSAAPAGHAASPEAEGIMQEAMQALHDGATKRLPDLPGELKSGINPPSRVNLKEDVLTDKQVYT